MNILETKNLSKHFGGIWAVKDLSISLKQGGIASIIGPNGAGKTSFFNLVSGVYQPDEGSVTMNGEDITGHPQYKITHRGLARTFQNIRLFEGLSVLENVMTARDPFSRYSLLQALLSLPGKRREEKDNREFCRNLLAKVGLSHLEKEHPGNLSYGLQRKLEIARALATGPKLLLLDEPAAGLNPSEVRAFIDLVYRLKEEFGLSILLIEHRMQVVLEMSEWIYVINFGEMLAQGTASVIQRHPEVIKAYIGEDETC